MMIYDIDDDGHLCIDGERVEFIRSPNQSGRMRPRGIIDHDTAGTMGGSINWFSKRRGKRSASAHFLVDRDGRIVQMVQCDRVAWHAGTSIWKGKRGLNAEWIGVEMVNPGRLVRAGSVARSWWGESWPIEAVEQKTTRAHGMGHWLPYTQEQTDAVIAIHAALKRKYPTITEIIGHYHCSPRRKIDPNPIWNFSFVRSQFERSNNAPATTTSAHHTLPQDTAAGVQQRLADLGYSVGLVDGIIGPQTEGAILAFQRENNLAGNGILDDATKAALFAPEAKEMPRGGRELTTPKEIIAVSRTAKEGAGEKNEGVALLGAAGGLTALSQAKEASDTVSSLVVTWGGGAVLIGLALGLAYFGWRRYRKGWRIIKLRLDDHKTGRNLGGPTR